jgi:hypothetical protein
MLPDMLKNAFAEVLTLIGATDLPQLEVILTAEHATLVQMITAALQRHPSVAETPGLTDFLLALLTTSWPAITTRLNEAKRTNVIRPCVAPKMIALINSSTVDDRLKHELLQQWTVTSDEANHAKIKCNCGALISVRQGFDLSNFKSHLKEIHGWHWPQDSPHGQHSPPPPRKRERVPGESVLKFDLKQPRTAASPVLGSSSPEPASLARASSSSESAVPPAAAGVQRQSSPEDFVSQVLNLDGHSSEVPDSSPILQD